MADLKLLIDELHDARAEASAQMIDGADTPQQFEDWSRIVDLMVRAIQLVDTADMIWGQYK